MESEEEKNWMDRCDVRKMSLPPLESSTTKIKPTKKRTQFNLLFPGDYETGPGLRGYKVNKNPRIDVSAKQQELVRDLKTKLLKDAAERGSSVDFDGSNTEPRGLQGDNYYDYDDDFDQYDSEPKAVHLDG